jgi:hypothetical protein
MKFASQVGLALLVNLAIFAGGILPGVGMPIDGLTIAQAQSSDELDTTIAEGTRLLKEGSKEALMAAILKW